MKTVSRILGLALCLGLAAVCARAADSVDTVIQKARARLGSEAALGSVKSLHFFGTIETAETTKEGTKKHSLKIELIFQKPYRQLITVTSDSKVEVTGLDDYEAWQRQQDTKDPKKWILTLLPAGQLRGVRANAWENLSFFGGSDRSGVRIEDRGQAMVDGVKCRKIGYFHSDPVSFVRYFAEDTGKLMLTETNQGVQTIEEGELVAGGIKFARQVISKHPTSDGSTFMVTIVFDRVVVNEEFPDSLFAVPSASSGL